MFRHFKSGLALLGAAYFAIGLALLVLPQESLNTARLVFGGILAAVGAVNLVRCILSRGDGWRVLLRVPGGVIPAVAGLFFLSQPQAVTALLPLVFGACIALDGVLRLAPTVTLARSHGRGWPTLLLLSALSAGMGVLAMAQPFGAALSTTMLCGVLLVIEGVLNVGCLFYIAAELSAQERVAKAKAETAQPDSASQEAAAEPAQTVSAEEPALAAEAAD